MLIIDYPHFLTQNIDKACVILPPEMKSNQFKYISVILLAIFLCAISAQNISALSKNFNKNTSKTFLVKKRIKSIHTSIKEYTVNEENLFENEPENKSKTEFNAALPILSLSQNFTFFFFPAKPIVVAFSDMRIKDIQPQLYLTICSFRI